MSEWQYYIVDLATGTATGTTAYSNPALVRGFYVNTTLSGHTVSVNDSGSTPLVIPSSAAAGKIYPTDFAGDGVRYENNIIVVPETATGQTGNLTIIYAPLRV